MKSKDKKPLRVALYGMDGRSYKTMVMFLQGPCKGVAVVVEPIEAEVDIIDVDFPKAKAIFEERRQGSPERPIIAMSLGSLKLENCVFLKKPVTREGMLAALEQAKTIFEQASSKSSEMPRSSISVAGQRQTTELQQTVTEEEVQSNPQQYTHKIIDEFERKKTTKHQSALQFNEGGFSSFIGLIQEIDRNDRDQVLMATYNPRHYFQGYVKSAFNVANSKARVVQLNSGWKPLLIFPHSYEIWLDANDKQLRAFAGLSINNASGSALSLSPVDIKNTKTNADLEKFQSMESFLWKLAIWTSKGRYPTSLNIDEPIYLKRWPNMTRLIVTPHALRISALLIKGPRTMLNIAEALNIKLQYVFIFVSACQALDLIGQAKRQTDQTVAPVALQATASGGLFKKILNKLRA